MNSYCPAIVECLGTGPILFAIDWELGLALLGAQSISILIAYLGSRSVKVSYNAQIGEGFTLFGKLIERIQQYEGIHLFDKVQAEINVGIADIKRYMKQIKKDLLLHQRYGRQKNMKGQNFWSKWYCVSTTGLAEGKVLEYIRDQEKRDRVEDERQLNMMEI